MPLASGNRVKLVNDHLPHPKGRKGTCVSDERAGHVDIKFDGYRRVTKSVPTEKLATAEDGQT